MRTLAAVVGLLALSPALASSAARNRVGELAQTSARTVGSVAITARLDEADGDVVVTLKNSAPSPLEAWRLNVTYATRASASSVFSTTTDTIAALALLVRPHGIGPLDPSETRELRVAVPAIRVLKSVAIDGALFGDRSFQGDVQARAEILKAREAQAAELAKWIAILSEARSKDAAGAAALIRNALAQAPASDSADGPAEATRHSVARLLASPDLLPAIEEMRAVFERLRQLALRHRAPSGSVPGPQVASKLVF